MNRKLMISLVLAALALAVLAMAPLNISRSASKSYHGLTRVTWSNRIIYQTSCCWNAGFTDSTNPARSMDTFAVTVWTTYLSCDNYMQYKTWYSTSQYYYNRTSIISGMARTKSVACGARMTRRVHNDIKHYWKDGSYAGDGATLAISEIQ